MLSKEEQFLIEFLDSLREHLLLKDNAFILREEIEDLYQDLESKLETEELKEQLILLFNKLYDYHQELKATYYEYGTNSGSIKTDNFWRNVLTHNQIQNQN